MPGEIEEAETAGGEYQADIASFVLHCPKRNPGEHFEGLEMLTKLLTPAGDTELKGRVEELPAPGEQGDEGEDEDEDIDWYLEQTAQETQETMLITESTAEYGYGFNFNKTGVFKNLLDEFGLLLDVKNPDSKTLR